MTDTTIYNFDQEIDRTQNGASKWGYMFANDQQGEIKVVVTDRFSGPNRMLPLWVADMDFPTAQPIIEALTNRVQHGAFGYTNRTAAYNTAVVNWMQRHYAWAIEPEWFVVTPGVIPALSQIVNTFTNPGDGILVQTPVYFPFYNVIQQNGRQIVKNPLIYENGRYRMDFEDLAKKTESPQVKMLILCNPHNPIGRVWTPEELFRLGDICNQNNVLVVSDEIHGDLTYDGHTFTNYATLSESHAQKAIIYTSASKTFNLAGLKTSNIVIPNPDLRAPFEAALQTSSLAYAINLLGMLALQTAYEKGDNWLEQLLVYLAGNLETIAAYLPENTPEIQLVRPEGTHLAWLDCSRLELEPADLHNFFTEQANVYLEEGDLFGPEGAAFMRLNFACPRPILIEALERIGRAVANL